MVHAWAPIQHWFTDFNSVSWSISTELFFYLMFPLLLLGSRKFFPLKLLLVFLLGFACLAGFQFLYDTNTAPSWLDEISIVIAFPLIRLCEFTLGMATCLFMKKMKIPFTAEASRDRIQYVADSLWELFSVSLIVVLWLIMVETRFTNFLYQSPDVGFLYSIWVRVAGGLFFFAFLIYVFASRRGFLGQIMASRPGVWLGEISFAFYLIHQIVIVRLNFMALNDFQFAFFAFGIALSSAALLYRVVEMPCRNALMCVYDRKPGCFSRWTLGFRQVFSTRMGNVYIVAWLILIGLVWIRPVDDVNRAVCAKISDNTPDNLRNVVFREEAVLMGFEWEKVERGVMLRMAWKRKRSWTRRRFLHLCDANGKIIGQGPQEELAFRVHSPNQPFVDEVVLHKRLIKNVAYVAVGFWSPETECAAVEHPDADMGGYRIKILDLTDLK